MMVWLLASAIGVMSAAGIWLLLRARTFDVLLGLSLLSYAVNLFILAMGRIQATAPPLVSKGELATLSTHADPLPQALVLTAIVISCAMSALLASVAIRSAHANGSDHVDAHEPEKP